MKTDDEIENFLWSEFGIYDADVVVYIYQLQNNAHTAGEKDGYERGVTEAEPVGFCRGFEEGVQYERARIQKSRRYS